MPPHTIVNEEWDRSMDATTPRPQYLTALPESGTIGLGDSLIEIPEDHFLLLIIHQGSYSIQSESMELPSDDRPRMHLVPMGCLVQIRALEDGIRYTKFAFRPHPNLCMGRCVEGEGSTHITHGMIQANPSERDTQSSDRDTVARPRRAHPTITSIVRSSGIDTWLSLIDHYLSCGDIGIHFFDFKLQELFLLLRIDYTKALVDEFLLPYHCRITGFRRFIMSHYTPNMDVEALYKLKDELKLNSLAFKRTFIEEFVLPPREWISMQRARYLYRELIETDLSMSEIATKYGFCSMSYFSLFCKVNLGDTPMSIRKRNRKY